MTKSPWFIATRPWSLVASAAPVCIGTALAIADKVAYWQGVPLLFLCAALIQISSNLINDYEDHKRGADAQRIGPIRAVSSGLLSASAVRSAAAASAGVAFLLGLPLVAHAGWPLFVIGCVCLVAAWAYTGGPYPMAYHGLGDAAAFLFFGVVAVVGTYFAHSGMWSADAFILSLSPGMLAANILNVNNIRDIPTDTAVGKRTLAVILGDTAARGMYALFAVASVLLPGAALSGHRGAWMWLPATLLPVAVLLAHGVIIRRGAQLQQTLKHTAGFYLMYMIVASIAIIMAG